LRRETDRLIAGNGFDRFVTHFTNYWLSLRDLRRDDPDIRLYPEYRLDDYLVESMGLETRAFFGAMIRENLPVSMLIDADFTFVNDRLSHAPMCSSKSSFRMIFRVRCRGWSTKWPPWVSQ
jgi:hypothetical protein